MKFLYQILDFLKTLFPSTRSEIVVFLLFVLGYGSLAYFIAVNFSIVFDNRIPWDAYFSFDNRAIVLNGGGYERHPLANYYFDWIKEFALWISNGKLDTTFRIVLALMSSITVSFAQLQIFKYLKNVIRIPLFLSVFLVVFSGIFVTPLLLSFTPETYTYTFFFLTFYNYYVALVLRKNKTLSLPALSFFSLAIGGLTITNIVKVYIPMLFEHRIFSSWKKFGWATIRVVISIGLFILLFLNRLNFNFQNFITKSGEQYGKFSKVKSTPLWDMIYSWFFGGSILFSGYEVRDYHNLNKTFYYKALFMDVYQSIAPYIVIGIIFISVFWSYFKNFKNKLVQILMISFLVDILIHCVMKFGIHTAYIYGGHFVFIVPLMLGWLFYAYRNQPRFLSFLFSMLGICFVFFAMNNYIRFEEFLNFLQLYYKTN